MSPRSKNHISKSLASLLALANIIFITTLSAETSSGNDQIFKKVRPDGKLQFSNYPTDSASKPTRLPKLKKENYDKKINYLKSITPKNCSKHGGIDCILGPDKDGSVVCADGYLEAVLPFKNKCSEARLKVEKADIKKLKSRNKKILRITLRNYSPVKAKNVSAEIALNDRLLSQAKGPTEVEPWGIAEYSLIYKSNYEFDLRDIPDRREEQLQYRVRCKNCAQTLRKF